MDGDRVECAATQREGTVQYEYTARFVGEINPREPRYVVLWDENFFSQDCNVCMRNTLIKIVDDDEIPL